MSESREFDVIVWGATGFTGKLVAEYLTVHSPKSVKFAIGGRSIDKLQAVADSLKTLDSPIGRFTKSVPVVAGNANNKNELIAICKRTKVVISTVGPYAIHGYPLVEACIAAKTDYVDLTGEPQFVKTCIERYHDDAVKNGVLIVHSTGFDSIPSDLGAYLIANHFKSKGLATDNVRFSLHGSSGAVSGGTIASGLNLIETTPLKELKAIMSNPDSFAPDLITTKKAWNGRGMYYDEGLKHWQAPFVMEAANLRIVRRSNYLLNYGPDFQYCEGMRAPNVIVASLITIVFFLVNILTFVPPVRWAIKRIIPPGSGPSEKARKSGFFKVKLFGEATKIDGTKTTAHVDVIGVQDPGYGETSKMISEAALCLALNRAECARPGNFKPVVSGIATPASAMGMVLIERLRKAGMTFNLVAE